MKELNMSWSEIKSTPRFELLGLMGAMSNYNTLHAFDGYTSKDIGEMAKNNPSIRGDYNKYMEMQAKYRRRSGQEKRTKSFRDLLQVR